MGPAIYEFTDAAEHGANALIIDEHFQNCIEHIKTKHDVVVVVRLRDSHFEVRPWPEREKHFRGDAEGTARAYWVTFKDHEAIVPIQVGLVVAPTANGPGVLCEMPEEQYPQAVWNKPGAGVLDEYGASAAGVVCRCLIYLNMPMVSETETVDRANDKRIARGQKPNRPPNIVTIVRPHASKLRYLEYVRDCEQNDDTVPEKWWGGFWNFYWCGPRGEQWLEMRWIEGRVPEHKQAQYLVKRRKVSTDPSARMKQLAQRKQAKDGAS